MMYGKHEVVSYRNNGTCSTICRPNVQSDHTYVALRLMHASQIYFEICYTSFNAMLVP